MKPYVPGWLRWLEARVPAGGQAGAEGAGGGGDGGLPGEDGLWSPKSRPLRLLLLLGVLGLLLLTWGSPPRDGGREGDPSFGGPVPEAAGVTFRLPDGEVALDVALARGLEEALGRVRGVGRVHVFVTLESSARRVYAGETSRERRVSEEGGTEGPRVQREEREQWRPVLLRGEDGRSERAPTEVIHAPAVRGVLVVASGAGDARVRRAIVQAVEAVSGVGAHRIVVLEGR